MAWQEAVRAGLLLHGAAPLMEESREAARSVLMSESFSQFLTRNDLGVHTAICVQLCAQS